KSPIEWLTHHARTPPPHLAEGLPELARYTELDRALQTCLAKRREDRPASAEAMIALLESVEPTLRGGGPPSTGRTRHLQVSASSYVAAIAPDATLVPPSQPSPPSLSGEATLPPPSRMHPGAPEVP